MTRTLKKKRTVLSTIIRGARTHNLKNVDIEIPHGMWTVITGVSGSGKSSLAFDTLYAEAQRQYIESLSVYARQFLDQMQRPDLDAIEGLQPTLCIDQKSNAINPRSTVGTITEIYDYLRLLMSRAGIPSCFSCGKPILQQSEERIVQAITSLPSETRVMIMAPIVRTRKGLHREVFAEIQKAGLVRMRVDGQLYDVESPPQLNARENHSIEAIVDRIVLRGESHDRVVDAVSHSTRLSNGLVSLCYLRPEDQSETGDAPNVWKERLFSTLFACADCGVSYEEVESRTFSFNSPYGACPTCNGLGRISSDEKEGKKSKRVKKEDDVDEDGVEESRVQVCPECHGSRLRKESLAVRLGGKNMHEIVSGSITETREFLEGLTLEEPHTSIAAPILKDILPRLRFLERAGIEYLSIDRAADTLSGGELQRVRLATSIGSGLIGVCYVLDEPSIGLHPRDTKRLIATIRDLQKQGNTIVMVEHDASMMLEADRLVDLGPGAGKLGGSIVAEGTPQEVMKCKGSITADYLNGQRKSPGSRMRVVDESNSIRLEGATANNLQNVDVSFPLGCLIGIAGVSGSGKSSLINETLVPAVRSKLGLINATAGPFREIHGVEAIEKIVAIDQRSIGRSPRSTLATYSGIFDEIRKVYAQTRDAKQRGFAANRFSFNAGAGRCDGCQGQGQQKVEMNFLSDVYVTCNVCGGKRFNRQTLQVKFKDCSIADCLDLDVEQATAFFENFEKIHRPLDCMRRVGLGYLSLGQPSTTLSGGESQRIKLATELARPSQGKTLYVLDEPTTGLHFEDVCRLIEVLQQLADKGNSVLVIEHNEDVISACDWMIELGPEGGKKGGRIVYQGPGVNTPRKP